MLTINLKKAFYGLLFSLSLLILFSSSEALAGRRNPNKAPVVAPTETVSTEVNTPTDWKDVAFRLSLIIVFQILVVIYLSRKNTRDREAFADFNLKRKKEISYLESHLEDLKREITNLSEQIDKEKKLSNTEKEALKVAKKEIEKLKKETEEMILVDPETEEKAKRRAEIQAAEKAEAEKKAKALEHQIKIKREGKEKLRNLLTQMKRGY